MKGQQLIGLVAAAMAVSTPALASDVWNDTGATYIDAMLQYSLLDDERISKDDEIRPLTIANRRGETQRD